MANDVFLFTNTFKFRYVTLSFNWSSYGNVCSNRFFI